MSEAYLRRGRDANPPIGGMFYPHATASGVQNTRTIALDVPIITVARSLSISHNLSR